MSRTYRNLDGMSRCALRHPKTSNERKSLIGLLQDNYVEEYEISGLNHIHHRLANCPTAWDDKVVSGYYQEDYKVS
jgi:hypothetical protein